MLKVMLVDDEPFIRQGIRIIINWEEYGYEIVAEAENGFEALKILEREKVDLVFADLKMPGMSGLELIESSRNLYGNQIQFIILTGYADFYYAKEAIRLSVRDYLLKPIQEQELIRILKALNKEYKQKETGANEFVPYKESREPSVRSEMDGRESSRVLEQVEEYVQENYDKNLSLRSIGEIFYMNNVYLGRIFKKKYGVLFRDYLNGIRMDKAMELLLNTDEKVYKIAQKVGFSSVDYFINRFIQEKGITPRRWRMEQMKGQGK